MSEPEYDIFNLQKRSKKLTDAQKRVRQKQIEDVGKILRTPEGRRYFWRKMDEYGIFRSSFNLNSNLSAFNEGQQNAGLDILRDVSEADPSAFAQMQNEYVSALKSKKEARNGS